MKKIFVALCLVGLTACSPGTPPAAIEEPTCTCSHENKGSSCQCEKCKADHKGGACECEAHKAHGHSCGH